AAPLKKPEQKPWGQTVAYVRDLNGFLVEICSPVG
ncbi:MAG: VOC family protein, partial [Alphaproteobacteria bacterium]